MNKRVAPYPLFFTAGKGRERLVNKNFKHMEFKTLSFERFLFAFDLLFRHKQIHEKNAPSKVVRH